MKLTLEEILGAAALTVLRLLILGAAAIVYALWKLVLE